MQIISGFPADRLPAVSWRKSRGSNPSGSCVEVAGLPGYGAIAVRDSRDPAGPALIFTDSQLTTFVVRVKSGEFDDLHLIGGAMS